jgi:hypothetical protein
MKRFASVDRSCRRARNFGRGGLVLCAALVCAPSAALSAEESLALSRDNNFLVIEGPRIPGGKLRINYLEAYCRANSADADWVKQTVIPHTTELVSLSADRRVMKLKCTLADGVVAEHTLTAGEDEVDFQVALRNPGTTASQAQWAQACVRLGPFTGFPDSGPNLDDYLGKCFIFLDGKLTRLPTVPWTTEARYKPGQVWRPANVPAADVNPRPLNPKIPSNGLIGCFSGDESMLFATAWEPYQELFQGVARCLHADFRIGGLQPGEIKRIHGKVYLLPNDVPALLKRYAADFPEHFKTSATGR